MADIIAKIRKPPDGAAFCLLEPAPSRGATANIRILSDSETLVSWCRRSILQWPKYNVLEHSFTSTILRVLKEHFGEYAREILEASPLLGYLNLKTRSANKGSKARGAFANHYALSRLRCLFQYLERLANEEAVCPSNAGISAYLATNGFVVAANTVPADMTELTRRNFIEVRIFARNKRQVLIREGRGKGRSTAVPTRGEPYLTIDASERARRDRMKKERALSSTGRW